MVDDDKYLYTVSGVVVYHRIREKTCEDQGSTKDMNDQEKIHRVHMACPMESLSNVHEALRRTNGLVIRAINLLNNSRRSVSPPIVPATTSNVPFKESTVISFVQGKGRIHITKPGMNHALFVTKCRFKLRSQDGATHTYELVAYVGDGVTGQIYIANHFESKTRVAVKIFSKMSRSGMEDKEITLLRSLTLSDLRHENLINIHHYSAAPIRDRNGGHGFIVMELAENGELFDYICDKPFNESFARYFIRQVVNAVEHLHSRRLVHRDLKPENFLLDARARLRICDFGHAKRLSEVMQIEDDDFPMPPKLATTRTKNIASPAYKAPILNDLRSNEEYDATKVDVWEIGVALYVMLAQAYPFGQTKKEINRTQIQKVLDGRSNFRFWQKNARDTAHFSEQAKAFLNAIFRPEQTRATVSELQRMPWLRNASVPSRSDVIAEMKRRAWSIGKEPIFRS